MSLDEWFMVGVIVFIVVISIIGFIAITFGIAVMPLYPHTCDCKNKLKNTKVKK